MRYQSDPLIHVEFVDAASGAVLAYTEMPLFQLPESFGPGATMNVGHALGCVKSGTGTLNGFPAHAAIAT